MRGELADYDVSVLKLAALKGIFTNIVSETVSYVNAPLLAEQRGIAVRLITDAESDGVPQRASRCAARSATASQVSVSGTLTGTKQIEKIVEINGYDVEVPIAEAPHRDDLHRPPRHRRRLRHASSARPASTSPACRSPAARPAARRSAC